MFEYLFYLMIVVNITEKRKIERKEKPGRAQRRYWSIISAKPIQVTPMHFFYDDAIPCGC